MSDDMARRLATLDRPVEPPEAFADALLDDLLASLERRARWRSFVTRPAVLVAGAVGVVALLVIGFGWALSRVQPAPIPVVGNDEVGLPASTIDLAIAARDRLAEPPPFRVRYRETGLGGDPLEQPITWEVTYAGPDAWRIEQLDGWTYERLDGGDGDEPVDGTGHLAVWDGEQLLHVTPATTTYELRNQRLGHDPLSRLAWAWEAWTNGALEDGPRPGLCQYQRLPDTTIVGRRALVVRCAEDGHDATLAFDAETWLPLRLTMEPDADDIALGLDTHEFEMVSLELDPEIDPADLSTEPPADMSPRVREPVERSVIAPELREPAPELSLPLLDGTGPFDLESLRGSTVVVVPFASWCPICDVFATISEGSAELGPGVTFVGVSVQEEAELGRQFSAGADPATVLVSAGPNANAWLRTWAVEGIPTWTVIDPDLRIAARHVGLLTTDELVELVRATG